MNRTPTGRGFFYATMAYILWGLLPLYWKLLSAIDSRHILSFRILFSLVLVSIILISKRDFAWIAAFRDRKRRWILILTASLLCLNWGLYIWAVNSGHTLATSLGYYITPLVSISLGLLLFREHLRPLQWIAVFLALAAVLILTILSGALPWVSLGLAFSFGFYGMLKKKVSLSALESLGAETLASVPIGVFLLCLSFEGPNPALTGFSGLAYLAGLPFSTWALLFICGAATMLPLYWFALAAKLLPLSAIGFCQFISPTMTFVLGVFVFKEAFSTYQLLVFLIIWIAVILYIVSLRPHVNPSRGK